LKDSSCWHNDLFFYTSLYYEVKGIRAEVEDMNDEYLVDEVAYLCEDNDEIDTILYDFVLVPRLSEEQRQKLIDFYVICSIENCLMIMEDGEF